MRMHLKRLIVVLMLCAPALGADYSTLVPFSAFYVPPPNFQYLSTHVFEGTTAYAILRYVDSNNIYGELTRVDHIDGTPVTTLLVSKQQWIDFTGLQAPYQGFSSSHLGIVGDYLQFFDITNSATPPVQALTNIYRVHKSTGALSLFVSKAQIETAAGVANAKLISETAFGPDNQMVFYDQTSDNLLQASAAGVVSVLISKAQFLAFYGYEPVNFVSGGLAYDSNGNLYWSLSNTGSTSGALGGCIFKRQASDGAMSIVLTQLQVQLASDSFGNVAYNDIHIGPDCHLYMFNRDAGARCILSCDISDPANTLAMYLDQAQLASGPMATFPAYVGQLLSYDKLLTWSSGGLSKISASIYGRRLAGFPSVAADFDANGPVNTVDRDLFRNCSTGPGLPYDPAHLPASCTLSPNCRGRIAADFDKDGDVDQDDFGFFQRCYGPTPPAGCAD